MTSLPVCLVERFSPVASVSRGEDEEENTKILKGMYDVHAERQFGSAPGPHGDQGFDPEGGPFIYKAGCSLSPKILVLENWTDMSGRDLRRKKWLALDISRYEPVTDVTAYHLSISIRILRKSVPEKADWTKVHLCWKSHHCANWIGLA